MNTRINTAVIDPSTTGANSFVKTQLNNSCGFHVGTKWTKLLGVCPIVVIRDETPKETVMVRIDIESFDLPYRSTFVTKPIEPQGRHFYVQLQDMHELDWLLKQNHSNLAFYGTNILPYTSAPHVGFQLIFEEIA